MAAEHTVGRYQTNARWREVVRCPLYIVFVSLKIGIFYFCGKV